MATYSMELRTLIEQPTQHRDDLTLDQRIEVGRVMLFDFDYPMFDARYKRIFETNFIRHFYYREIGYETEFMFKQRLRNWLNLNMGYYSKLFESELLKFDPFINSKVDVTHTKKNDRDSISDTVFDESTSRDADETITTDEDSTKDTEQGVIGRTTYDTDYEGDTITDKDGNRDLTRDTDTVTDSTGETSGQTDADSRVTSEGTSRTDETRDTDSTKFNRNLHTDTPDERLAITTNDGDGTVGYASTITEDKETSNENVDSNSTTNTTDDSDTTSSETTSSNTIQNETGSEDTTEGETTSEDISENETYTKGEQGSSNEDTDISEVGTRDEVVDRILKELGNRNYDQNVTGNIKDLEDYVEHRVGKIGIQTYSKMLMEFRQTFLRIEVQAFREMERLFMLVY